MSLLFPTSVVGSMPRPEYVKDLIFEQVPTTPDSVLLRQKTCRVCQAFSFSVKIR